MIKSRKITLQEEKLLELLIQKSNVKISENWKEDLLVSPMNDDNMGSLILYPKGEIIENRIFGE